MITTDLVKYSIQSIGKRKLRSWLTIISIMTGIAAIYVLISFGQGLSTYVDEIAEEMGSDKLIIQPRGSGFGTVESSVILDEDDLEFIRDIKGVDEATGIYFASGSVEFDDKERFAFVLGSDFKEHNKLVEELYTLELEQGRMLEGDEKNKVVLGHSYLLEKKIFPKAMTLRNKLVLNGIEMKVIGFYEEVGNPQDDSNVYLNLEAYEDVFEPDSYQFILARSAAGVNPSDVVENLEVKFRKHRGQKSGNQDFQVQTFEQLIETFSSILQIINVILILIALISVVVAGVNIMNTMYTAVLERTKEIGIMKAIGARRRHILLVFLVEAGIIGGLGGAIGVGLGHVIAQYAAKSIAVAGFSSLAPRFSIGLTMGCILFAFLIGIISGFLPAKRAALLNAVDALRYE